MADLREAIRQKGKVDKLDSLERRRSQLVRALALVDRAIARLDGQKSAESIRAMPRRKKFSRAARAKMKAAAIARWKKIKSAKGEPAKVSAS